MKVKSSGVLAGDLGVVGIGLQGDQASLLTQCSRHPDRAVGAQRSELQHLLCAQHPDQKIQELA
jgi:hypothetical protein